MVKRFDVYWVCLDLTIGSEMKKVRPCVVLSPDSMNRNLPVAIVAPLTTVKKKYPTRVNVQVDGKNGQVVLDQIKTYDKLRFGKKMGTLHVSKQKEVCTKLQELFHW